MTDSLCRKRNLVDLFIPRGLWSLNLGNTVMRIGCKKRLSGERTPPFVFSATLFAYLNKETFTKGAKLSKKRICFYRSKSFTLVFTLIEKCCKKENGRVVPL